MKGQITKENIVREIKRAEALSSSWCKLTNEEKIDEFIERADKEVLNWHLDEFSQKRKVSYDWETWKQQSLNKFSEKISIVEVCSRKQKENETVAGFIREIVKGCEKFAITEKDRKKLIKKWSG